MGNQKYIVTVRFPSWGYEKSDENPAFGVRYLIEIPANIEEENHEDYFLEKFQAKIGGAWKGEILFFEQSDIVSL